MREVSSLCSLWTAESSVTSADLGSIIVVDRRLSMDQQIIYPVDRLLANPKVFMAIANEIGGPDWETLASAFYDLIEVDVLEADSLDEAVFGGREVCFRHKPDDEEVIQVILNDGTAIELHPSEEEEYYAAVRTEEELGIVSSIYGRLVRAIEEAAPEFTDNIALCEPPTPANSYLRDEDKDCFSGQFHLLSDPDEIYDFDVEIVSIRDDELKASVRKAL